MNDHPRVTLPFRVNPSMPMMMMTVRDLMTPSPAAVTASEPLSRCAELMRNGRFGLVPVVDDEGRPIGVVTPRDACMATLVRGCGPQAIRVDEAMSRDVATIEAEASLAEAQERMARALVRRLPVIDADGRLVGVLSLGDIARAIAYAGYENGHGTRSIELTLARLCNARELGHLAVAG